MADLLDEAVAKVRKLSADRQREAAQMLMEIVRQDASEYRLSAEQLADLSQRLAEQPPEYLSDAELEEMLDRFTH